MKPKTKPSPSTQPAKFREAARELGCDEGEAAFDERLRKVAKAPPIKETDNRKAGEGKKRGGA
jgi:hypothetical protein